MLLASLMIQSRLLREPLWIDELHTSWAIDTELSEVADRAAQGNQTPIYFWIEWAVSRLLVQSPASLRLASMLFSAATLLLAMNFVWQRARTLTGVLTTGLLLGFSGPFLFYATEARPYALLGLAALGQMILLERSIARARDTDSESYRHHWILWAATFLATLLIVSIHLTALLLVGIELVLLLLFGRRVGSLAAAVASGSLLALMLHSELVFSIAARRDNWDTFSSVKQLLIDLGPLMLAGLLVPTAVAVLRRLTGISDSQIDRLTTVFFFTCGVGPIMVAVAATVFELLPVAHQRYLVPSIVALPIAGGLLVGGINSRRWRATACLVAIFVFASTDGLIRQTIRSGNLPQLRTEDWQSAVNKLDELATPGMPLFLFPNLIESRQNSGSDQAQYLRFSVSGIYKPKTELNVVPMATDAGIWTIDHLKLIRENSGGLILARVTPCDMSMILLQLQRQSDREDLHLQTRVFNQTGNRLVVVLIHTDSDINKIEFQ